VGTKSTLKARNLASPFSQNEHVQDNLTEFWELLTLESLILIQTFQKMCKNENFREPELKSRAKIAWDWDSIQMFE